MSCDAGAHWICPARNTVTVPCQCICHRLGVMEAMRLEGLKGQIVSWRAS